MKILKVIYIIGLSLPIINIISIYLLLNSAFEKLGRMPRYGDKRTYNLELIEYYDFTSSAFLLLPIPLLLLVISGIYFLIKRHFPFNTNMIFIIFSLILYVYMFNLYGNPTMEWYWD